MPVDSLPPREQLPAAPLLVTAYAFVWIAAMVYVWTIWRRLNKVEDEMRALAQKTAAPMTAGHFIFIPSVLLIGVVIGWMLGSRAARDAFAKELQAAGRARRAQKSSKSKHFTV